MAIIGEQRSREPLTLTRLVRPSAKLIVKMGAYFKRGLCVKSL